MRVRLLVLAALACLPLACKDGGCGGGSATKEDASAAPAATAASSSGPAASGSGRAHRMPPVRAAGAVGALIRATNQLDLKEEQRAAIEKVLADLREGDKAAPAPDGGAAGSELRALHEQMVLGVKAGKVDLAKLEPHFAALEREAKERHGRDVEALAKVHAILEPAQRVQIVSSVRKAEDERASRMKGQEALQAARAADGGMTGPRRRYERWGRELTLDDDQKKKLEGFIPKEDAKTLGDQREEAKKRVDATLALFEKDTFDPKVVAAPDDKRLRQPYEEQARFFNQLIPILKPDQKDKLAQRLERQGGGPSHARRRGPDDHDPDDDDRDDREVH